MVMEKEYVKASLKIRERGKAIPYPHKEHENSITHDFIPLKRNLEAITCIPEVKDNKHLRNALMILNGNDTAFFTVGCEKAFNKIDDPNVTEPYWAKGFLDISFNYRELVGDAVHYFQLFFFFNQYLKEKPIKELVHYQWDLVGANFLDAGISGWTAFIWIIGGNYSTSDESEAAWGQAVDYLVGFLKAFSIDGYDGAQDFVSIY